MERDFSEAMGLQLGFEWWLWGVTQVNRKTALYRVGMCTCWSLTVWVVWIDPSQRVMHSLPPQQSWLLPPLDCWWAFRACLHHTARFLPPSPPCAPSRWWACLEQRLSYTSRRPRVGPPIVVVERTNEWMIEKEGIERKREQPKRRKFLKI